MIALVFVLLGATVPSNAPVGFIDIPSVVASHPLHAMLAQYDREIIALERTLRVPGLGDVAARTRNGDAALRRDAASAQNNVLRTAANRATDDRAHERAALASVTPSQKSYAAELARETSSSINDYAKALAQRNARALAARRTQLHEKELTLAFDLARASAGQRLALTLKLQHLHLDRTDRAALQGQLSTIDRRDWIALAELRAEDAGVLAAYGRQLARDAFAENSRMVAQLQAKANANLARRQRVLHIDPQQAAAFAASYRDESDAATVATAMRGAAGDISQRFDALAQSAGQSERETTAAIAALKSDRDALYRAMVAQIRREGELLVRSRHLATLDVSGRPPKNSVDLTGAARNALRRS